MSAQPRLLLLFSSSTPEESTQVVSAELGRELLSKLGTEFSLTPSLVWYRQAFPRCGSWDSWIFESVHGVEYGTRRRHFDGFVVCAEPLGRATGALVASALLHQRAVLRYVDGKLGQVRSVHPAGNEQFTVEHAAIGD
jgi:hypothetical protein